MTSNQRCREVRHGRSGARSRALCAGLALAGLLAAFAPPALADSEHGQLKVGSQPGTIVLHWTGKVAAPMAQQIQNAFEQRKHESTRVVLTLASGGGSVREGERVIEVLRRIKQTHRLQTVVGHGRMCGSMCVFIYVQGEKRTAALSSTWLFHEVSKSDPHSKRIVSLDRAKWEQLVATYWVPAGVSPEWIERIKPLTVRSDYWQTGADLVNENSGIVHEALGNQKPRIVADGKGPATMPGAEIVEPRPYRHRRDPSIEPAPTPRYSGEPRHERPRSFSEYTPTPARAPEPWAKRPARASQPAPGPERSAAPDKECRIYVGSLGMVVTVPCPTVSLAK